MQIELLAARLDVLGLALVEIARALSPAQATQAREAIGRRIADMAGLDLQSETDEAITVDLVPLLGALRLPH